MLAYILTLNVSSYAPDYIMLCFLEPCRVGVDLKEEHPVKDVKFNKEKGLWTVTIENSQETFQACRYIMKSLPLIVCIIICMTVCVCVQCMCVCVFIGSCLGVC